MTCKALIDKFLFDYHAGNLSLARKLDFELHLTLCGDCRRYVDSYRKTIDLAKQSGLPEMEAPSELVETILKLTREKE